MTELDQNIADDIQLIFAKMSSHEFLLELLWVNQYSGVADPFAAHDHLTSEIMAVLDKSCYQKYANDTAQSAAIKEATSQQIEHFLSKVRDRLATR